MLLDHKAMLNMSVGFVLYGRGSYLVTESRKYESKLEHPLSD